MEDLARFAARRPVAMCVLALAVALLGWISWQRLPLDLLPDIQSPTVLVSVSSGDRPPTEMERIYGENVEQRLFTVRGIREITQVARTGRLIATVTFDWDADMDLALVDVQKAMGPLSADPDVEEVLVRRFDPRQLPVLSFGLLPAAGGGPDLAELRRIARRQVAPALEQLSGVAEVRVTGGREKEVRVVVDRYRLEARGLTLADLESRLSAANVDVNAGTLEEGNQVFLVRGLSRFRQPEDVARVVLRTEFTDADGTNRRLAIRVGDVADVTLADREIDHVVRIGSHDQESREGVGLEIYKEAGANTVATSRRVRDALEGLTTDLPGVEVRLVSDEAALVEDALADVQSAAGLGILLAIGVLALFLRSLTPTVIVASAVPVSLLAALFLMRFGDHSLNLMTLAGLALGAGMLVDNAIVVVESIFRRRDLGDSNEDAAARGTGEVAGAIAASTLTTCVVFLPVIFVRGLAARLVEGIAFTVVVSLAASLAVAALLIPALARWFLPAAGNEKAALSEEEAASPAFERLIHAFLARPFLIVFMAFLIAAGAIYSLVGLGTELLPPADPRQFSLRLIGPAGQRVEATERVAEAVEGVLREAAANDLAAVMAEVGRIPEDDRLLSVEQNEESTAQLRVRLANDGRTGNQVVAAASNALADLPRTAISWDVGASALSQALGSGGAPIVIEISGRSLEDLQTASEEVLAQIRQRPELWNAASSFEGGPPELRVNLDHNIADALGVDLEMLARVLESSLDGRRVTVLSTGDEERDVVIRLPSPRRDELLAVPFTTPQGARLTVGQVASFESREGAREVHRRDQRRVAQVTARIAPGYEYPEAAAAAREVVDTASLPPGLRATLAGEEEEREATVRELGWAGALALVLVLMVLAGTFESFLHPLTVLAAVPLASIGVAVALVPAGKPIGVMAMLGAIVLAGVAVNDAILLVATARRQTQNGLDVRSAVARAAAIRLRPITMTTMTTVLALLPLAIGAGEAAELRAPMAITIIGGLIAATLASLFVLPCCYLLLERRADSAR